MPDALMGVSTGAPDDSQDTVEIMEFLAEVLADAFCRSLDVDGTFEWHEEMPSAESLRRPVEDWVQCVVGKRGVWPSQRAAVTALMMHGTPPAEARRAARAAFRAQARRGRVLLGSPPLFDVPSLATRSRRRPRRRIQLALTS